MSRYSQINHACRAALKADAARTACCNELGRYQPSWLTAAQRRRIAVLDATYHRAMDRMVFLLENSQRSWQNGVPSYWPVA